VSDRFDGIVRKIAFLARVHVATLRNVVSAA